MNGTKEHNNLNQGVIELHLVGTVEASLPVQRLAIDCRLTRRYGRRIWHRGYFYPVYNTPVRREWISARPPILSLVQRLRPFYIPACSFPLTSPHNLINTATMKSMKVNRVFDSLKRKRRPQRPEDIREALC